MADEILNQTTETTQDYYQDENLETINNLKLQQQRELAERDAKYAALLKAYTSGERDSSAEQVKTLTPEEELAIHNANCTSCINDKLTSLEMAKKMMEVRDYKLKTNGKDIFCGDVTPSDGDAAKAQQAADYIKYAIDNCDGDNEVFSTLIGSHLVEVLKK